MRGMKCGTCYWAREIQGAPPEAAAQRVCFGMPPTVCILPVQQMVDRKTLLSNPNAPPVGIQMVAQSHRRHVAVDEDCCSLWEAREEVKEAPRNKWRSLIPWLS